MADIEVLATALSGFRLFNARPGAAAAWSSLVALEVLVFLALCLGPMIVGLQNRTGLLAALGALVVLIPFLLIVPITLSAVIAGAVYRAEQVDRSNNPQWAGVGTRQEAGRQACYSCPPIRRRHRPLHKRRDPSVDEAPDPRSPWRDQIGIPGGITSEWMARSDRNGWRHQIGTGGGISSESAIRQ